MPRNRVGHGRRRRPRSHKVARAGRAEPPGLEIVCPLSILVGTGSGTADGPPCPRVVHADRPAPLDSCHPLHVLTMPRRLIPFVVAAGLAARVVLPDAATAGTVADTPRPAAAIARSHLAVIVNRANPVASLSRRELRAIFLGEQTTWQHGRRTTPALREPGQPERAAALRLIYGMSEADLTRYFLHRAFMGGSAAGPRTLATAEGVKRFVVNVPGAIGMVRLADVDDTVKAIRIDDAAPGDAVYALVMDER